MCAISQTPEAAEDDIYVCVKKKQHSNESLQSQLLQPAIKGHFQNATHFSLKQRHNIQANVRDTFKLRASMIGLL